MQHNMPFEPERPNGFAVGFPSRLARRCPASVRELFETEPSNPISRTWGKVLVTLVCEMTVQELLIQIFQSRQDLRLTVICSKKMQRARVLDLDFDQGKGK
jgi:hypothetical protein